MSVRRAFPVHLQHVARFLPPLHFCNILLRYHISLIYGAHVGISDGNLIVGQVLPPCPGIAAAIARLSTEHHPCDAASSSFATRQLSTLRS